MKKQDFDVNSFNQLLFLMLTLLGVISALIFLFSTNFAETSVSFRAMILTLMFQGVPSLLLTLYYSKKVKKDKKQ